MIISLIVAMTPSGVIGDNGKLPWHDPEDMKRFRLLTLGKPVIMGRKTFHSLKKPLSGRHNIVLTRDASRIDPKSATAVGSLDEAFGLVPDAPEVMILGGCEIYKLAWDRSHRIYLTLMHREFTGDTRFPIPLIELFRLREDRSEDGQRHRFFVLSR